MASVKQSHHITFPNQLTKTPTFISGLDAILLGGLPQGRTTVLTGSVGSGKTLFGLEFIYRGALAGEPGIFVGFEEPSTQLRQNVATLGWDIQALERENRLFLLDSHIKPDTLLSGEFSLKGLLAVIRGKTQEMGAKRIVLDALEVALRLFDTPQKVRNELHLLNEWLTRTGLTTILTLRPNTRESTVLFEDFYYSMSDCVIEMNTRVVNQISTQRLRIIKYRGSSFGRNEYPYVFTHNGLHIAPISTVGLRHQPLGTNISSGHVELDTILAGGYARASCTMLAGQPGSGKTILASTFVATACRQRERVLYISFEESEAALIGNVRNAGIDLQGFSDAGLLLFLCEYPEAMGAEEHYVRALFQIDEFQPAHVVIDAISACERMGGKQASFEYLMRLLNLCKTRGITILMINQTTGIQGITEISGNGISSMVDTVIKLDYCENYGELTRLLQVLKTRGSAHSNQKREYRITSQGIHICDVYLGEGNVLTGTARQIQEEKDRIEAERLALEIQTKSLELKYLKSRQKELRQGIDRRSLLRRGSLPESNDTMLAPSTDGNRR